MVEFGINLLTLTHIHSCILLQNGNHSNMLSVNARCPVH